MSILLCVLISWVTFGLLLVGLGLLIVEHFSNTPQVTKSISEAATQMAKLDRAMDEPVQKAREPANAFDARAQLEGAVTLAPRDAIPTSDGAVADPRRGAVIIRDPRLTRAKWRRAQRNLRLSHGLRRSRHCRVNRI